MITAVVICLFSRLEVVVDPWLEGLWKAIKGALSKMASNWTSPMKEDAATSPNKIFDSCTSEIQLNLLSLSDPQSCDPIQTSSDTDIKYAPPALSSEPPTQTAISVPSTGPPVGNCGIESVKTQTGHAGDPQEGSLTHSLPPLSESSLNVPALPPPYLDVSLEDVDTMKEVRTLCCYK